MTILNPSQVGPVFAKKNMPKLGNTFWDGMLRDCIEFTMMKNSRAEFRAALKCRRQSENALREMKTV